MAPVSGREGDGKGLVVCAILAIFSFHCGPSKVAGAGGMVGAAGSGGGAAGNFASGGQGGSAAIGGAGGASTVGTAGAEGTLAAAGAGGSAGAGGTASAGGSAAAGASGTGGTAGTGAGGAGGAHPQLCPDGHSIYPYCPGGPCQTNADCADQSVSIIYKCFHDQLIDSCASAAPGHCLPWVSGNCATHTNTCGCFNFPHPAAFTCTSVGGGASCVGTTIGITGPNECYGCSLTPQ
jgi:hypothetical protein